MKSRIQKLLTPRKIQNEKSVITWQTQKLKYIKQMENICHFSYFSCRKYWTTPGLLGSLSSHLYDNDIKFNYVENNMWKKQIDIIETKVKIANIGLQQSTLRYIDLNN